MKSPRYSCRGVDPLDGSRSSIGQTALDVAGPGSAPTGRDSEQNLVKCPAPPRAVLVMVRDAEMRGLLRYGLKHQGFELLEAGTGGEGIELVRCGRVGSVLLDMDVADTNGLELIKRLREISALPILALAGRVDTTGVVDALDHGANDFVARPFQIEEISARLRAARRNFPCPANDVFRSGSLIVDLTRRIVRVGERIVNLSATEYSLLHLFVRHAGLVLTHAQILREVWGAEMVDKVNYLRIYLMALRKKLENPTERNLFLTERAIGYRLVVREA